ncbi:hypothetical protein DFH08DRAFT_817446 [Mycena albidolilacea]|uniref:Uncharacterized protein n=1 Tax=Mycena albidolilacea TaxID=1033008 RepID=A0AAD6ZJ39_9AGAR|nr:hypothetical protein DFH08DRAFT_817446 [Mycena albidolilacea]
MDAPHDPSARAVAAPNVAPALPENPHGDTTPTQGLDRTRLPPQGESVRSSVVTMADLALEYTAGSDSVSRRATSIVAKTSLDSENIVDRGNRSRIGQFGLETNLFLRVGEVVIAMQSLLTRASSITGKQTCFIVDPHRTAITDLRGAGNIEQLPCAWDCLVERLRIAQDKLERYLSGHLNDPERQACDAAVHRRVMHWAAREDIAQRARRAAGTRTQGEPPNLAQAATVAVSPPERSPPLSAVGTNIAAEPQPPSHPMEDGIRMNESTETTGHARGHAPAAATPAAVKDPPCDSRCDLLLRSTHKSGAPFASSPASTTSAPLGASASVPSELSAVLADSGLQKLVPARSQNIRTEDELGGRVRQQSSKNSIGAIKHSVSFPSPAPVLVAGVRTVELGGRADAPTLVEQDFIMEADILTLHTLDDASSSGAPDLVCTTPASALPLSSSVISSVLSPFSPLVPSASVITYLDFALVSAILRTFWTTYLVWIKCADAALCLAWEREGIGTGPWN